VALPRLGASAGSLGTLDRLGWADGLAFESHGARLGIRVSDPGVMERLANRLPPRSCGVRRPVVDDLYSLVVGDAPGSEGKRSHALYSSAKLVARSRTLDDVLDALENALHVSVALRARRGLFVHAGVVAWHGKAIVIPGRSMSGKSSLVKALVDAGATYYSDEFAVIDRKGRVHPYAKPLSLRPSACGATRKVTVESLGGRAGTGPLRVGMIVAARFEAGAHWRPRRLSPGEALLAMLDNTVLARVRPRLALTTLKAAVPGALALKGRRGEATEVAERLLRQMPADAAA
jgi:hypothetical protein